MSTYIDELKKAMQEEYNALEMAQKQQEATLNQQKDPIKQDAAKLRGDTYTSSRVSAIGNNEVLAQKGLAGSVYKDPRSGYSETSRVRQDTALRNALNAADLNEQKQLMAIEEKIKQLGYDTGKQKATVQAKWNEKIAQAVREDELRRIQQEREDQLRREQWEREDRQRQEDYQRQLALASASRSYSSGGSGRSSSTPNISNKTLQEIYDRSHESYIGSSKRPNAITTSVQAKANGYSAVLDYLAGRVSDPQAFYGYAKGFGISDELISRYIGG